MSNTCVKQIMTEVGARLEKITVANEYNYTVKKVEHAKISPFKSYDLPFINYWQTGFQNGRNDYYNGDERTLPIYIEGYSTKWEDGAEEQADKFVADIITVLYRKTTAPKVSDNRDLKLNGLCTRLSLTSVQLIVDNAEIPYFGTLIQMSATYYAKIGDMFVIDNF